VTFKQTEYFEFLKYLTCSDYLMFARPYANGFYLGADSITRADVFVLTLKKPVDRFCTTGGQTAQSMGAGSPANVQRTFQSEM
jgi:hypothetical protein